MQNSPGPHSGRILSDLIAGMTLAIVKVPQAMANAVLASVNPVAGLYALMVAMPIGALFSSSAFMNVSTTGVLAIAVGEALYTVPYTEKMGALVLLVLMIGVIQLVLGLLGIGRLTRYVSNSVMKGFLLGIAVLIMISALRDMTGFESGQADHLLRLAETALNWRQFDPLSVAIGLTTILVALLSERTRIGRFAPILALACGTALAAGAYYVTPGLSATRIGDVLYIASGTGVPYLPRTEWLADLLLPALSIAIIGMIQTTGVNQSFPNPDGRFPDASRDFVSVGAANIASSFFGAIPSSGSLSGTTILLKAGAQSRWANIFAGAGVQLICLTLLGIVTLIPIAAIGGLLFVIGLQNIQPTVLREIWRTGTVSRAALCGTALATLLMPLHFAILTGVLLSFLLQVLHLANCFELRQWQLVEGGFPVELPIPPKLAENDVCVAYTKGVLFFASAQSIADMLPAPVLGKPAVLVLVLRDMDDLGSTVVQSVIRYANALEKAGNKLVLAGIRPELLLQLERTSLMATVGRENVHIEDDSFGASLNEAVLKSRAWIEAQAVQP